MNINNEVWNWPATYWFWHYVPQKAEIDKQLEDMKAKGIMSFQIAVRLNMPLKDYLSEDYLNACKIAADKAEKLGMVMGIYDDYNWQSGHAAGKTVANHPELRERQLFWTKFDIAKNLATISHIYSDDAEGLLDIGKNWIYENGYPKWDEWKIISVIAVNNEFKDKSEDEIKLINLTDKAKFLIATEHECKLCLDITEKEKLELKDFEIVAFISARCKSSRIINYLLPKSSEEFIKVNYEVYRKALAKHFGKTVQYMFFDQPHSCFYNWQEQFGEVKASLMASDNLFLALKSKDKLENYLMALVMDIGKMTTKWRCEFFDIYSKLAIDSYFKPLADWCKNHYVMLSGHEVLGHIDSWSFTGKMLSPDTRCNFGMNYFAIDKYRDLTAVDAKNSKVQISAKMGDSVAIANGKSKCIIEHYYGCEREAYHFGVGEWEITLEDLRKQAICHHLLGARQFLTHAYWLSNGQENNDEVFKNPRWDFAPGINFEPWFRHYREFAIQSKNLSKFLDLGKINDDVAIFYPLRTFWAKGLSDEIGEHGALFAKYLMELNYEYHLIDEMSLLADYKNDFNEDSLCKKLNYKALIMPYCEVIYSKNTLKAIEKLLTMGVKVIFTGKLPQETQEQGVDIDVQDLVNSLCQKYKDRIIFSKDLPTKIFIEKYLGELKQQRIYFQKLEQDVDVWTKYTQVENKIYLTIFNRSEIDVNGYLCLPTKWDNYTISEYNLVEDKYYPSEIYTKNKLPLQLERQEVKCFVIEKLAEKEQYFLADNWLFAGKNIIERAIDITKTWEKQGLEQYSDIGIYTHDLTKIIAKDKDYKLILPKVYGAVKIFINDIEIASKAWGKYEFVLAKSVWQNEKNILKIEVAPTVANEYYEKTSFKPENLFKAGLEGVVSLKEI